MTITRYHVVDSMEEWLAIECHSVETVILEEGKIPRFEFNVKIVNAAKYREFYFSSCVVFALKDIKNYLKSNNILYKPSNHIKFAFEYIDSTHCYKFSDAPKPKRRYPQPADYHVAMAVVTQLFDTQDVISVENEDVLVYYYLSVLRAVNHPVINHARFVANDCPHDQSVYTSAVIPKCERPNLVPLTYYSMYADLIYFLGLLAPPVCVGDTVSSITTKVRRRHEEQLEILCHSVGITKYTPIRRGEGWQKLTQFLEANPLICRVLATTILKPPEIESPMTVIENQVTRQVKQLWLWTGLSNFRDCYEFAMKEDTDAHSIPVINEQCELVKLLYGKLRTAVVEESLIPYAKLLVDDQHFFDQFDARHYPDLFYASRSSATKNKSGNPLWEEFVATRVVTIPREEIDEKLKARLRDESEEEHVAQSSTGKTALFLRPSRPVVEAPNSEDDDIDNADLLKEVMDLRVRDDKDEDRISLHSDYFEDEYLDETEDQVPDRGDEEFDFV